MNCNKQRKYNSNKNNKITNVEPRLHDKLYILFLFYFRFVMYTHTPFIYHIISDLEYRFDEKSVSIFDVNNKYTVLPSVKYLCTYL